MSLEPTGAAAEKKSSPRESHQHRLIISYFRGVMQLTNEELVKLIRAGQHDRMGELYEQNRGMIRREARRFARIGVSPAVDFEDFMQTGYFALAAAVATFDESRGAKFLTILIWCLKRHMKLLCGLWKGYHKAHNYAISLDEPLPGLESEITRAEMLIDMDAVDPYEAAELDDLRRIVRTAVGRLPDMQRMAIERYYFHGRPHYRDISEANVESARRDAAYIRLRRDRRLKQLMMARDTIIYQHVGLKNYKSSWDSAVELAAIKREELLKEIKALSPGHFSIDAAVDNRII